MLVCEEGRRQLSVYFNSRSLKGPETRYQPLEKLALALVNVARRLWPYFHAQPIRVLTDHPLRQILIKPEASGRVAKWEIELGEHDITYLPRLAIKGQALADFLVEMAFQDEPKPIDTTPAYTKKEPRLGEPDDCWQVYVDGASRKTGSRAEILLISPDKQEITYSLQFGFSTTNNEVQYEVLLARLRLAREMKL